MEIDGAINLDRLRIRRIVPIVAMILPMVAVIGGAAWFVRAYVAPPMVSIPAPSTLASWEPPPQPAAQQNAPVPSEPVAPAAPAADPLPQALPPTGVVPMLASLAFVPPSFPATDRAGLPAATTEPRAASPKLPELTISVPEQMSEREPDSRPEMTAVLGPGSIFIVPLPRPRPNY
jgi:hypothetical protein